MRSVAAACPGARDVSGATTVAELGALMARAVVCVTNDSGPMHYAVALGRPVVSVFGPTDPVWIGPYGQPDAVVRAGVPCAPCYLRRLSACPHDHACMRQVTAAMVLDCVIVRVFRVVDSGGTDGSRRISGLRVNRQGDVKTSRY